MVGDLVILDSYLQYLYLFIVNFASVAYFSTSGVGNAIIFHSGYYLCKILDENSNGDPKDQACPGEVNSSVFYISLTGIIIFPVQTYLVWKFIRWDLICYLSLLQPIGMLVGNYLLRRLDMNILTTLLGLICFGLALKMIQSIFLRTITDLDISGRKEIEFSKIKDRSDESVDDDYINHEFGLNIDGTKIDLQLDSLIPDDSMDSDLQQMPLSTSGIEPKDNSINLNEASKCSIVKLSTIACGFSMGLLMGMFSTGGPPLIGLAYYLNLEPSEVKALSSFLFSVEVFLRVLFNAFQSPQIFTKTTNRNHFLVTWAVLILSGSAAMMLGNVLAKIVNTERNHILFAILLLVSAMILLTEDHSVRYTWMTVLFSSLIILIELVAIFYLSRNKKVAANESRSQ